MTGLETKLDREAIRIQAMSRCLAAEVGSARIFPEMYGLCILRYGPNGATNAIESLGGRASELLPHFEKALYARIAGDALRTGNYFNIEVDESCRRMVTAAEQYRVKAKAPLIGTLHILLGVLATSPDISSTFDVFGIGLSALRAAIRRSAPPKRPVETPKPAPQVETTGQPDGTLSMPANPLATFCIDLNAQATAGRLEPVIGRERELLRLMTTLCRKKKNNPLLVGPEGTGKTAIVEGLAQRLVAGQVPPQIAGRRIFVVDLARLVAGTQFRGQFEERLKNLLDAARCNRNAVLFIDEAHTIVGAGAALGTLDARSFMKPALARGEICCIGATTETEYRKFFRKDKALDRRFQRIPVDQPTAADTLEILKGLRGTFESHHRCKIDDEALQAAIELSGRHITDRYFPDKAIDVVDETCARFANCEQPIGREQAAQTVAELIGAPLSTVLPCDTPRAQLVHEELCRLVAGQDEAIETVTRMVQRAFSPLRDPLRPLASMVFGGPSSVGKSYVAQILSRQLYASTPLIRINLAEFTEKHSVSRLIGSPPGYVGFGDKSQLTDPVLCRPNSVIVFENADKAHPEVLTMLMELLDAGVLTDAQGQEVNFRSTFVVFTTVAGADGSSKRNLGFGAEASTVADHDFARARLISACRNVFGEEFVNRVDEFVPFAPLGLDGLRQVAEFAVDQIRQRLAPGGITLRCDDAVLDQLARRNAHARAVRCAVKNELEPLVCAGLSRAGRRMIAIHLKDGHYTID